MLRHSSAYFLTQQHNSQLYRKLLRSIGTNFNQVFEFFVIGNLIYYKYIVHISPASVHYIIIG